MFCCSTGPRVSNEFFVDLDGVDHNTISDLDIGLLYCLFRSGESSLRIKPDLDRFAGGRSHGDRHVRNGSHSSGYVFFAAVSKYDCWQERQGHDPENGDQGSGA